MVLRGYSFFLVWMVCCSGSLFSSYERAHHFFEKTPQEPQYEAAAVLSLQQAEEGFSLKEKEWTIADKNKIATDKPFDYMKTSPVVKAWEQFRASSDEKGVLLTRYFPSPQLKGYLLQPSVLKQLSAIYFDSPSLRYESYFSSSDRAFLQDLVTFGVSVFWVNKSNKSVLKYTERDRAHVGMFVPLEVTNEFKSATFFGVYGSHIEGGKQEKLLEDLFKRINKEKTKFHHPLLNSNHSLAVITGGGPGVMEMANRAAKKAGLLSCAHTVDFSNYTSEHQVNPYYDSSMSYRYDELIERQSHFRLDFPIVMVGGIGTDFEYSLELGERKIAPANPTPVLLVGNPEYWKEKITSCFQCNRKSGTVKGSEWVSNCFYCIQSVDEAMEVYTAFARGKLAIGKMGPIYKDGFCTWKTGKQKAVL